MCGCGKSLNSLTAYVAAGGRVPDLIGVNDAGRDLALKYLVVVNHQSTFHSDRWAVIKNTDASVVFTHLRQLDINRKDTLCVVPLGRHGGADLGSSKLDFTSNSPYLACILAYKLGYRNIGLVGVDFTPDHYFGRTGTHQLQARLSVIDSEFMTLRLEMERAGAALVNLSAESALKSLVKVPIEVFAGKQA